MINSREKISELASLFPGLFGVDGLEPWDSNFFDMWATRLPKQNGSFHAARFILSVWDPLCTWRCGVFSFHEAMLAWNDEERKAFLTWAEKPWWAYTCSITR